MEEQAVNVLEEALKAETVDVVIDEKYLNSRSIKYVSGISWGNLKKKIKLEIKSES